MNPYLNHNQEIVVRAQTLIQAMEFEIKLSLKISPFKLIFFYGVEVAFIMSSNNFQGIPCYILINNLKPIFVHLAETP
jgi:hypothetical protein